MEKVTRQYYPNTTQLQKIRGLLPKKNDESEAGTTLVAIKSKRSKNAVYKVLKGRWENVEIIKACLDIIINDAQNKIEYAQEQKEKLVNDQRV